MLINTVTQQFLNF